MKRVLLFAAVVTLTLNLLSPVRAAGLIIIDDPEEVLRVIPPPDHPPHHPPHWPRPFRPIHRFTPLEIRSIKATATIKDQVAQTKIEQEFYNPNARQLEGTFILPLPKGAHLEKFRMEVNGKMMDAELLTAEKAKGIYEEIVRKAKDPALLEYVGRDLLKVRIFPIEPHSTKKIEVSYAQVLKRDTDLVQYTLPLNTAKYCATPIKNFSLKLDLESATALNTIYSPTHNIEVNRKGKKAVTIGLEEEHLAGDKDFELFYSAEKSELGLNLLTYRKGDEDGYFMLFASPAFEDKRTKIIAKDVVFVIDTSGSMSGKKLEQAKKALVFCVQNLNEDDRFDIIRFSTETEAMFGELRDVSEGAREDAEEWVNELKVVGGTAINDALRTALETADKESNRPKLVVFLTDGLPTVGDTSVEGILKTVKTKSKKMTRIFAFGVGTDVNTQLLDRIAEETSAVPQYVLPDEDIEVKLSSFFSKINDPVLADLELDFGDIKTSKIHPGKLPDLFKGQQLIVLGRYKSDGKTMAKLTGKIGDEEKEFTSRVEFEEESTEHEFIPRLWATRRVGYLLEEIRDNGEERELKEEVTELAKQYGMVTPYTSYLVTEDAPVMAERLRERESLVRMYRYAPQRASGSSSVSRDGLAGTALSLGVTATPEAGVRQRLEQIQIRDQSGDGAVASARYNYALKSAVNEAQVQQAPAEVNLFVQTGQLQSRNAGESGASQPVPPPLQQKFVGGRAFRFDQGFWVESAVEGAKDTLTKIEFDSNEYWELVSKHPELRDVLALGTQVRFRAGNKIYEIFSKNN